METLLAYFTAFQATLEEAEQVLSLLPHVARDSFLTMCSADSTMHDMSIGGTESSKLLEVTS